MPKKQVSGDRKARIAEMQQQEKARENRVRIRIIAELPRSWSFLVW